jgi:hypothetical protein
MNLSLDPFHWQLYIDPSCNNGQQEVQYKMFCELGSSILKILQLMHMYSASLINFLFIN